MLLGNKTRMTCIKSECKEEIRTLQRQMGGLQRQCREKGIPIVILIAGPSSSGKGRLTGELLRELDPRGFRLHTVASPPTDDLRYPYLKRFWDRLPAKGAIGVFIDNWYRALLRRSKGFKSAGDQADWCHRINLFEQQLTDSGCRIIKFYLHTSKREQKKRLKKLASHKNTSWRVTSDDWKMLKKHDRLVKNASHIIESTHRENAPWIILPADNGRYASLAMLRALVKDLERTVAGGLSPATGEQQRVVVKSSAPGLRLDDVDLSHTLNREDYDKTVDRLQTRLQNLHSRAYRKKIPVIIAYEGWDAAGKGGTIKRLARGLDPRGYEVLPIGAPAGDEKTNHYLWRFWKRVPRTGHIAIFDRTWYGRVLVEKIEGFCSPDECERAYTEILEMEREWTKSGIVLLKFWIHIDKEEQLRRFKERQNTSNKQWKITDEDWRNRDKWDQYAEAVDLMLQRTHSDWAPWTIVESNCKLYARIKVLKTVVDSLEARL